MANIIGPYDIAARVDTAGRGVDPTRDVNRAERALLAQQETVSESGAVKVPSNNIALVVDSVCLRARCTRIIDGGEHSVLVEEEAMQVNRVIVEAYDISGSIDRVRIGVGRAWVIYGREAVSTAEVAEGRDAIIIFADNVAAGIDSPARCVHSAGHIKGQKRSPRE